ncbi:hypothetical protein [Hymenobacter cellulosivorans]|uniref:Uncharacterized protein n=1 Tax=Hymenobacter cellulosivorans TaxID=2932249 RepID=A0ABY4FBC8_9BACT|nr:hypothetical protein [Hymenobacter cellulosivorans]UOQ53397.1 hypothetical protein MUN80_01245 [Hymenobacter cellulosivorans]
MPRLRTYPPTTDFTQKIHLADLRRWGYLQPGNYAFTLTFYNPYTGAENAKIACELSVYEAAGWLRLCYSAYGIPYNYVIELEAVASNLGRGAYFLFKCPLSGRRAKTLYSCCGSPYFAHRVALGVKYETQYVAGPFGAVVPFYKRSISLQKAFKKPYRKEWYAGKLTRWYLAALRTLDRNEESAPGLLAAIRSRVTAN